MSGKTLNTYLANRSVQQLRGNRQPGNGAGPSAMIAAAKGSNALKNPVAYTENGALSNATTLSAALDFFGSVLRGQSAKALRLWRAVRIEVQPGLARRLLFQLRDVRGGRGEREIFRLIATQEAATNPEFLAGVIPQFAQYGRFDDLFCLLGTRLEGDVVAFVKATLINDLEQAAKGQSISLLAKWMPSESSGSKAKIGARQWQRRLNLSPKEYRLMLSNLRSYLDIVERKMSQQEWAAINFSKVSSRSMYVYRDAFNKRDGERFRAYLAQVVKDEKKMNAGNVEPYEIINQYETTYRENEALEAIWKSLPGLPENGRAIVPMIDTSGSMSSQCPAGTSCLNVALGTGLYYAQRNPGEWQGTWFNFSNRATMQRFNPNASLRDILRGIDKRNWMQTTNFQAMFDMCLEWYDLGKIKAEDIPAAFIVFSDMQFNEASPYNQKTNFKAVQDKFAKRGLTAPILIFWNLAATTDQPVVKDDIGAVLLSGYSASLLKAVNNLDFSKVEKVTPESAMMAILMGERYNPVG